MSAELSPHDDFPATTLRATPLRAVLIDLDGTLMDTAPDLAEAANRMRADFALPPLPQARIAAFVGKGADLLVHRALTDSLDGRVEAQLFSDARAAFFRHYHVVNGDAAVVFDGAAAAVDALRSAGLHVACVTNKPREFTVPLLERMGLAATFDAVVAGDDVERRKPHPDLLLEACRRLEVAASDTCMIGDSINDAQAAAAAGCACCLVETGYNEGEPVSALRTAPGVLGVFASLADAARALYCPTRL